MRNVVNRMAYAAILLGISGLGHAQCDFKYSADTRDNIVKPIMGIVMGERSRYFNIENPTVTVREDGTVRIIVSRGFHEGRTILFENSFVFVLSNCGERLTEFYEARPYSGR